MKRFFAGAVSCWVAGATSVSAQDICVTCAGPPAVYRCSIEKADKVGRLGSFGDKAIDLVCSKEMARQGGHESCAVRRDLAGAACTGTAREIPLANALETTVQSQPQPAAAVPAAPAPTVAAGPAEQIQGPPRTVQEMAERTGASSKQQLKNIGDSVGSAATKTWDCLTSLFKKC